MGIIYVENERNADLFVTLWDKNKAGGPIVAGWNQKRLNADETLAADVQINGEGESVIDWEATHVDPDLGETRKETDVETEEGDTLGVTSY